VFDLTGVKSEPPLIFFRKATPAEAMDVQFLEPDQSPILFRFLGRPPGAIVRLTRQAGVQETSKAEPRNGARALRRFSAAVGGIPPLSWLLNVWDGTVKANQ